MHTFFLMKSPVLCLTSQSLPVLIVSCRHRCHSLSPHFLSLPVKPSTPVLSKRRVSLFLVFSLRNVEKCQKNNCTFCVCISVYPMSLTKWSKHYGLQSFRLFNKSDLLWYFWKHEKFGFISATMLTFLECYPRASFTAALWIT